MTSESRLWHGPNMPPGGLFGGQKFAFPNNQRQSPIWGSKFATEALSLIKKMFGALLNEFWPPSTSTKALGKYLQPRKWTFSRGWSSSCGPPFRLKFVLRVILRGYRRSPAFGVLRCSTARAPTRAKTRFWHFRLLGYFPIFAYDQLRG